MYKTALATIRQFWSSSFLLERKTLRLISLSSTYTVLFLLPMDYTEDGSDLLGFLLYLCFLMLHIKETFRQSSPSLSTCLGGLNNYFVVIYTSSSTHINNSFLHKLFKLNFVLCRSQWPWGIRRRSATASISWDCGFESHRGHGCVSVDFCLLLRRSLRNGLITRPENSYRLWCVVVFDLETSWMRRLWRTGAVATNKKKICTYYFLLQFLFF